MTINNDSALLKLENSVEEMNSSISDLNQFKADWKDYIEPLKTANGNSSIEELTGKFIEYDLKLTEFKVSINQTIDSYSHSFAAWRSSNEQLTLNVVVYQKSFDILLVEHKSIKDGFWGSANRKGLYHRVEDIEKQIRDLDSKIENLDSKIDSKIENLDSKIESKFENLLSEMHAASRSSTTKLIVCMSVLSAFMLILSSLNSQSNDDQIRLLIDTLQRNSNQVPTEVQPKTLDKPEGRKN
jgi:chromosome segregation ATPase